ncbi:MAG TPA: sigma-70 family RNA polymerase sigma factor [Fimbriimonas sp.]|nr:sigma-70 family RNA polymerase sigma factor [Fimbriimonas sp.]
MQNDAASEAALIEKCRRQDYEAFGKFVDAYQSRVFGFVRRMVPNAEEAADVAQEVFIKAFQNFNRFDGRSSVRTWLFRIAYHLCVDRARKEDRTPDRVALVDPEEGEHIDVPDARWQPDQLAMDSELYAVVEDGVKSMSEKLRSVLLLHDREDLPYEEIAGMLNVPVGTVKSRLFLARAHLQNVVKAYLDGGEKK